MILFVSGSVVSELSWMVSWALSVGAAVQCKRCREQNWCAHVSKASKRLEGLQLQIHAPIAPINSNQAACCGADTGPTYIRMGITYDKPENNIDDSHCGVYRCLFLFCLRYSLVRVSLHRFVGLGFALGSSLDDGASVLHPERKKGNAYPLDFLTHQ